jgi:sugar phosphate isomerase/epimerase
MIGLACSSLSCDGFVNIHFARAFEVAPQIGFKYMEFNCWHPSDLTPQGIQHTKRRCKEVGLTPISIYGASFGAASTFDVSKDVAHKVRMIEAARELGCWRIVATGAQRGAGGGLDEIITVLKEIAPMAEAHDVLICLENHANNNLEMIEDYERVFEAVTSPNVGLCVDTGHFEGANVDLDDVVDRLGDKINHIHVKEAAAKGEPRFVRFGEGVTDNNRLIERALERGYSGYISVELAIEDKSHLVRDLQVPYRLFQHYETVGQILDDAGFMPEAGYLS